MNVIIFFDDEHITIGVATSMKSGLKALIKNGWITPFMEFWNHETRRWTTIEEELSNANIEINKQNLLKWCLENIDNADVWENNFFFEECFVDEDEDENNW